MMMWKWENLFQIAFERQAQMVITKKHQMAFAHIKLSAMNAVDDTILTHNSLNFIKVYVLKTDEYKHNSNNNTTYKCFDKVYLELFSFVCLTQ